MTDIISLPPGVMVREYKILSKLGHGAFGITYLAIDKHLNKKVAIKEYSPNALVARTQYYEVYPRSRADAEDYYYGLNQFVDEAKTLASFDHPNIIKILSYFELNNTAYFVMEYFPGRSLEAALREMERANEKITQEEVKQLLFPLLDALATMHKANVLHRDIKPANIYIRDDNSQPVLLDFGAARHSLGKHSRSITTILTPGYAPIEQYQNSTQDQGPWTDIYGMAATIYRVITGILPIDAMTRAKYIYDGKSDPLVSVQKNARGSFDSHFLDALAYGLNIQKKQRPRTINEWKPAFENNVASPPPVEPKRPKPEKQSGKQFEVYEHPTLGLKVIKSGFSFGMLVAGLFIIVLLIWLLIRRMWLHSLLLFFSMLILTTSLGLYLETSNLTVDSKIASDIFNIAYSATVALLYGYNGNRWYSNNLVKKGYILTQTVSAKNAAMAMAFISKDN